MVGWLYACTEVTVSSDTFFSNCNCSWGTCIAPLLEDRGRITVNPYPGVRRQNETEMFSDHDETLSLFTAASGGVNVVCVFAVLVSTYCCVNKNTIHYTWNINHLACLVVLADVKVSTGTALPENSLLQALPAVLHITLNVSNRQKAKAVFNTNRSHSNNNKKQKNKKY